MWYSLTELHDTCLSSAEKLVTGKVKVCPRSAECRVNSSSNYEWNPLMHCQPCSYKQAGGGELPGSTAKERQGTLRQQRNAKSDTSWKILVSETKSGETQELDLWVPTNAQVINPSHATFSEKFMLCPAYATFRGSNNLWWGACS